jgi:hypothetical protein
MIMSSDYAFNDFAKALTCSLLCLDLLHDGLRLNDVRNGQKSVQEVKSFHLFVYFCLGLP